MGRLPLALKVTVVVAVVGVGATFVIRRAQGLRACGHPRDLLWEINPLHASHCCTSGRTVSELANVYYAQQIYHEKHGGYATSFEQLADWFRRREGHHAFYLDSDGLRWSVAVPQQATLAGSYLLNGDGKLYFSTNGPATRKDTVLRDLTR